MKKYTNIKLQPTSFEIWQQKYQLKDVYGNIIDKNIKDMQKRVAKALSINEKDPSKWEELFIWAMEKGATPAGRILSNAGAEEYKPETSLINCTVSETIEDSMRGILHAVYQSGIVLKGGSGIGYEFSTLRPKGAMVHGAGASTSGPISFMDIFDKTCFTVASAGNRRGAQMATFAIWHPDVRDFIKAKREDGRLRQFNMSLLIDDEFMEAVKNNKEYPLVFPLKNKEKANDTIWKDLFWDKEYCEDQGYKIENNKILCKIYERPLAQEIWELIMKSTYDYAEPGFLLIDEINRMNNNYFCELIRATNPCGEQGLPPEGACLLGSINLAKFVKDPFTNNAEFDWNTYKKVIQVFSRMLDNVVEFSGLPLDSQRREIETKRRHGMGFLGLGSAMTMLGLTYGCNNSIKFTEDVMKIMAIEGYKEGAKIAKEKGKAPILKNDENLNKWLNGNYIKKLCNEDKELEELLHKYGCRYTHATSIAPTGTISLSINNNASNGIEPTFAHKYTRNIIKEGKKSKDSVNVYSYEMLLYKELFGEEDVPEHFSVSDNVSTKQHVDIQAAAQKWCDSSISKTINVPTDMNFEDFKDIYLYAYEKKLKGCTTFRFNPDAFQGILVKEDDLNNTQYEFVLEDGSVHVLYGNDTVSYDGEEHNVANLYDSLKEGYYGKY